MHQLKKELVEGCVEERREFPYFWIICGAEKSTRDYTLHGRVAPLSESERADGVGEVHDHPLLSLQVGVIPHILVGMCNAGYGNGSIGCHKMTSIL